MTKRKQLPTQRFLLNNFLKIIKKNNSMRIILVAE